MCCDVFLFLARTFAFAYGQERVVSSQQGVVGSFGEQIWRLYGRRQKLSAFDLLKINMYPYIGV